MSPMTRRWLAAVLCLVMALGLFVPAGAAPLMLGDDYAVAEVPVGDSGSEMAADLGAVGTMPTLDHSRAVVETPDDDSGSATLSAASNSHRWTPDDTSDTFFTVSCLLQGPGTSDPDVKRPLTNFSWSTVDGVKETLSTQKSAKLAGQEVSFTVPAGQTGTFYMIIDSRATSKGDASFKLDGATVALSTVDAVLYTKSDLAAGTHTIANGKKQADIYMLLWQPDCSHEWNSGEVTTPATCTTKGVKTFTCALCGATKTEELPMVDHTPKTLPQVNATCKDTGKTAEVVCAACGKHISGGEVIPVSKDHDLDASFKCKVCGKQLADPGHTCEFDQTKGKVLKAATCTEDGLKEYPCKTANCDKTQEEVIPQLGHDLAQHAAQAASCTEAGWDAYEDCKRSGCTYTTKKVIPATGHKPNAEGTCTVCGQLVSKPLSNAGGWFESLYGVLPGMSDADVTGVSYSGAMNGKLTGEDLEYLVRDTADGVRVDIPGLTPGTYTLRITADGVNYEAKDIEVLEYDRSGYAHWNYTQGVGAYRDDGVLKENAIVLYVTEENKNTVSVESSDGTTVTGIGHILNTTGMDTGSGQTDKGGIPNNNKGIMKKLAVDNTPVVVRIIGNVTAPDGVTAYDSVNYGGSEGDNGFMVRMKDARNVTIEGVGPEATINGWGIHFMAGSGYQEGGKSFEVRNIAFRNVPEDCVGMEGVQSGSTLTASVERCWIHNCSFYAPTISNPAESDKDGGDGACDFKRGQYMTMDYCYYDGYHKTNLIGAKDDNLTYNMTWHHNYWKTCDSRGPLGRQANLHIYNCIYDGQTSFAQNTRANCYIFSEYNAFYDCKKPRRIDAGAIKSYNDVLSSCIEDATSVNTVTDRNQKVSSGCKYENFDTDAQMSYIPAGDYKLDTDHAVAKAKILAYAGPMKTEIVAPEDVNGSTVEADRTPTASVKLPYDQATNSSYISSSGVKDNIVFTLTSANGTAVKYGKDSIGQYVVFKVDEPFDVTLDGTASALINAVGATVAEVPGSATNLPAGVYYVQPTSIQPAKGSSPMSYKEGTLSHLTIQKTTATQPPHVHSYTGWKQTVAPTCTRTGTELGTCSCGDTMSRTIAKIDHDYVGGACSMCGVTEGTFGGDPDQPEVAVTGLSLSTDAVYLLQGKSERVIATVEPANATDKSVTWTSADPGVASVAKNGAITGKGPGQTTVTAEIAGFTQEVSVTVVAVSSETYTFAATQHGPATVADKTKGEDPVADATKWGTGNYFTNHGSGNKWKAKDLKKGDMSTASLLLATAAASSFDFTVAEGATATVTLNFSSTSSSNTSAIAILDESGASVDGQVHVVTGTGTQSATFELGEGTYQIVAPADVQPGDVNESWDAFPADANNPNKRGVRLIRAVVVEEKVATGDIVAVTGLTLNKSTATLEVGQTGTLLATVEPANATNKNVNWTTSSAAVATVSKGTVTARGVGKATITATCGGHSDTCEVTVTPSTHEDVLVTSIAVTDAEGKSAGAVTVDGAREVELQLFRSAQPEEADNKNVTWSSDRVSQGVSVNQSGLVTVAADAQACEATITAEAQDGSGVKGTYKLSVLVSAKVEVTGVVIKKDGVAAITGAVAMGHELRLTGEAVVKGVGGASVTDADKAVTWRSTDTKVATVKDGVVTPVGVGVAGIVAASVKDPAVTASLELTVTKGDVKLAIRARNEGVISDGGTILVRIDGIPAGVDASVTIEPAEGGAKIEPCDEAANNGWNYKATLPANPSDKDDVAYVVTADYDGNANWNAAAEPVSVTLYVRHVGAKVITLTKVPGGGTGKVEVVEGEKLELSVEATVQPEGVLTYRWFKDGVLIAGATSATYVKEKAAAADAGEYICRVSCEDAVESRDAKVDVTVKGAAVESVTLDRTSASVTVGRTTTLKATVKPDNASDKSVKWTSSDESLATVNELGVVTGKRAGTATITVTTVDGGKSATCTVTVTASSGGGGGGGGGGGSHGGGGGGAAPTQSAGLPFVDVAANAWYHDSVKKVYEKGLMKGSDATHFNPNQSTTRAMVATVLYRLDGEEAADVKAVFNDVVSGSWYAQAVEWAAAKGVVKGYDEHTFAPNDNVTREQLAVMLYRYAAPAAKSEKDLSTFSDAASVSDWALEAITWAVDKGIMNGKGDGRLDPKGLASRAEICAMLVRFTELSK